MNDIWSRLKTDEDRAVVKKMVEQTGHIDKFKKFGQLDFIDNNIVVKTDDEKEIFDQIVVRDMTLKTLEDDLQEVQEISLPLFKKARTFGSIFGMVRQRIYRNAQAGR